MFTIPKREVLHMTPAKASAMAVTFALVVWLIIVAYNAGRYNPVYSARGCETPKLSYSIPFKGTLP
jgi:hypothetical protein